MNRTIILGCALAAFAALPLSAETLRVGSTSTGVPFTFLNIETNEIDGMMVDLIEAIGEEAGFEPEVQAVDFASLIPSLTSDRIDLISAAMLITPTRQEEINFSDPVFPYGEGLVVAADDATQYSQSLAETAGGTIGVQQGTIYLEELQKMDGIGEIQVYDSLADMLRDLELGRIQAGIGDRPIIAYQLSQGQYDDIKLAEGYESQFGGSIGIGVAKGEDELLERVNSALATLKENGELDRIVAEWGLE